MNILRYQIVAAALLAISVSAHNAAAQDRAPQRAKPQATTDPLKVIYRASGVRDNGAAENVGVATQYHCSSFSKVSEIIRYKIFNFSGVVVAENTRTITPNRTLTVSTHGTVISEDLPHLSPGIAISQGFTVISATTRKVVCTVTVVDAATAIPVGTPLHLVRQNPIKGSSE